MFKTLARGAAIAGAAVVGMSAFPMGAIADVVTSMDERGSVIISGLTAYQSYTAEYTGVPKSRQVAANACGVVRLSNTTTYALNPGDSFAFNSASYEVSALPLGATPRCTNGSLAEVPTDSVFKDSNGNIYLTGLNPFGNQTVQYDDVPTARRARANDCGMIRLSASDRYPLGNFDVNILDESGVEVTEFNGSALSPEATPFCRRGVSYYPEGFGSGS